MSEGNGEGFDEKKLREMMDRISMATPITDHKFWSTQPVPAIDEQVMQEGPIEKNVPKQELRQEPYKLPSGYVWSVVDLNQEQEMADVYNLLTLNYVEDDDASFRFDYKKEFLKWGLQPPGYHKDWHLGVRVESSGKLVGFISGIPAQIRLRKHQQHLVEINFLCVHKKLRSKRLAPVLIKEVTRRVNLAGIFQAVYTAGIKLPKPVSICRYYHRSLNPKKLIEVGFSHLPAHSTMSRTIKLYRVPDSTSTPNLREMLPGDARGITKALNEYLSSRYDFHPVFTLAETRHWFTPVPDVVYSYVSAQQEGQIDSFVSFYALPSTVIKHPTHNELSAMYLFYYVPPKEGGAEALKTLINDALIMAKKAGADVFNCLNLQENQSFIDELKFGRGDGNLHYYWYNYRSFDVSPEKMGLVLI